MFFRNLKIREMGEALSNHAEVGQGIKKKTSMVLPTVMTSTFITSVPGADKDALHPLMVLAGKCDIQFISPNFNIALLHPGTTNRTKHCTKERRFSTLLCQTDGCEGAT